MKRKLFDFSFIHCFLHFFTADVLEWGFKWNSWPSKGFTCGQKNFQSICGCVRFWRCKAWTFAEFDLSGQFQWLLTAQYIYSTQKENGSSGSYHGHPIVTTLRHITCPSLLFTNYKNHLMQVLTNIRAWNTAWAPCCHRVCLNRRGTTTGWLRGTPAAPLCPRRR